MSFFKTGRAAAIMTGPYTHLDHLSVVCYIMGMPLLVTEESSYEMALQFYPQIDTVLAPLGNLSLAFLSKQFDVIFESGKCWQAELAPFAALLYRKRLRFVYCPHGNSDKGHSAKEHLDQDIVLHYGEQMSSLLERTGAKQKIRKLIRTGNHRLFFYQRYQTFYDQLIKSKIRAHLFPDKKTVLYAPSWQDGENPSSFFSEMERVIREVPCQDFNLIVKIHPLLEAFHPARTTQLLHLCKDKEGVLLLEHMPMIYPLLKCCDVYLGDYSSIGYDFLYFNRPLYFFAGEGNASEYSQLHSCGMLIPSQENIASFLLKTIQENEQEKRLAREEVYAYAFGEKREFEEIREEIERELLWKSSPL